MILLPNNILKCMNPEDRKSLGKTALTIQEIAVKHSLRLERELHKMIELDLNRRGVVYFHSRTDKRATIATGLPDFAFVLSGLPTALEIKLFGRRLTAEQETTLDKMRLNGWYVFVVYDFDGYLQALESIQALNNLIKSKAI